METLQLIKNRISNIAGTRQITESMRLVSTIKTQKTRVRMSKSQPFLDAATQLLHSALSTLHYKSHPYLTKRDGDRTAKGSVAAVVVISGDRGLCGGYNLNAGKTASELIKSLDGVKIITVGSKARDYCRRRFASRVARSFTGISEKPFYENAASIASILLNWYDKKEIDQAYVVYTKFENMLIQTPQAVKLLPIDQFTPPDAQPLTRCEINQDAFFTQAVTFFITAFIYGALIESAVCEQSARVRSMDSAVDNATEMMENLTLLYNQARQSAVTQEIIEIVNGADAI